MSLEEAVLAQAFHLEALMNVLERKGLLQKAKVLEEIKALQAKTPKAPWRNRMAGAPSDVSLESRNTHEI